MSTALEQAITIIAKRGPLRTDAIAAELGIGENAADAMLEPACVAGRLTTCKVVAGGRTVIEYRCSASGGSLKFKIPASRKTYQPPAALRVAPSANTHAEPKGEEVMKFDKEKVKELFRAHGPMTSRELTKHHGVEDAARMCALIAGNGEFGILGGTTKSKVYGLPEQSMSDRKPQEGAQDTPPRSIHARKGRKKRAVKAGSKAAKKAWKTRRKNARKADKPAAKSFRPALTADGAILFLGAKKGEFEIPRADTRALVDLVRKLTGPELAVAVGFIERLDRAEVAA